MLWAADLHMEFTLSHSLSCENPKIREDYDKYNNQREIQMKSVCVGFAWIFTNTCKSFCPCYCTFAKLWVMSRETTLPSFCLVEKEHFLSSLVNKLLTMSSN